MHWTNTLKSYIKTFFNKEYITKNNMGQGEICEGSKSEGGTTIKTK